MFLPVTSASLGVNPDAFLPCIIVIIMEIISFIYIFLKRMQTNMIQQHMDKLYIATSIPRGRP